MSTKIDLLVERLVHGRYLYLDLGLDILDGVRGLDLEGDGLAREGLDENLHLGRKFARPYLPTMNPEKEDVYKIFDLFVRLPKLSIKIA